VEVRFDKTIERLLSCTDNMGHVTPWPCSLWKPYIII